MEQSPLASGLWKQNICELIRAIEESKRQTVKQWLESDVGVMIRFDDVKVSRGRVMCKPNCGRFQHHQSRFLWLEALFISGFTKKKS